MPLAIEIEIGSVLADGEIEHPAAAEALRGKLPIEATFEEKNGCFVLDSGVALEGLGAPELAAAGQIAYDPETRAIVLVITPTAMAPTRAVIGKITSALELMRGQSGEVMIRLEAA